MSIKGPTVGTPTPRTNYEQTDPVKADYLKGKNALDKKIDDAQSTAAKALKTANEKAETKTYKYTLLASGWSDSAPFAQIATIEGMLSTDYPFVDIDLSEVENAQAVIEGWNMVGRVTVDSDNTVIGYCYEEAPAIDIPIVFKVVR